MLYNKVSIVIVNYNLWQDTIECLSSILKSTYLNYDIVLVDNASINNSYEEINNWSVESGFTQINSRRKFRLTYTNYITKNYSDSIFVNRLAIIQNTKNLGFAAGNNIGIQYIYNTEDDYSFVWFLNNDTIISADSVSSFVKRMEEDHQKKIGILGGKLLYYHKPGHLQGIGGKYNKFLAVCTPIGHNEIDEGQYGETNIKMDYIIGASMFVRKEFIDQVGLMNEDYFLYFEELDWIYRGAKKGWEIAYEPNVQVFHKEGASTRENQQINLIADICQVQNRILFTSRFHPLYLLTVVPISFGSVINRIRRGQYNRSLVIFKAILSVLWKILKRKPVEKRN